MSTEPLCGAETVSGGLCRRRVTDGQSCAQHRADGEVVVLAGDRFRADVLEVWELTGPELRMLDQAAATLDAIDELDAQVAADGVMVRGSAGQPVLNPAIAEARQQRVTFGRLLSQIDLPDPESETGDGAVWTPQQVAARRAAQARWRRRKGA